MWGQSQNGKCFKSFLRLPERTGPCCEISERVVLSCLANWHANTETAKSEVSHENKVKVERVSGSKYSLYISQTHCLILVFFVVVVFLESVPEGFGTIIHSSGHSQWTTHPKGGHTSYYGLKGQKEKKNKRTTFSCSHFFILSCVRNSFLTSSYTKKNIHEKQKQQTALKVKQPYVCILWTMLEEHFISQNALIMYTFFRYGTIRYNTNEITLLCDYA